MNNSIRRQELYQRASDILQLNDRGHYTVPTSDLYPFQWNWDSCLVSLGQRHANESRAWLEMNTLFEHQWPDGMVPHIVFHELDEGYFPGPDIWDTERQTPTTGITQPPVAAFAVLRLFECATDKALAEQQARNLLYKLDQWHAWFHAHRDPDSTGLVALIHPWESGRDNSTDWDEALARVPIEDVGTYQRRDTQHADASHRPTQAQYDAYISLVQGFRALQWDNQQLHESSPFKVVDPGFNAILIRSCADLATLAEHLGDTVIAERNRQFAQTGLAALESLWSDELGQYTCFDRVTQRAIEGPTVGGLLPILVDLPAGRTTTLASRIETLAESVRFPVPSHDPADNRFDSKRYWRGPSWLIINYLIADGLSCSGFDALATRIRESSLQLIEESGFAEYYDPHTGEGCGGTTFTWTAAMVLEFLTIKDLTT